MILDIGLVAGVAVSVGVSLILAIIIIIAAVKGKILVRCVVFIRYTTASAEEVGQCPLGPTSATSLILDLSNSS